MTGEHLFMLLQVHRLGGGHLDMVKFLVTQGADMAKVDNHRMDCSTDCLSVQSTTELVNASCFTGS